MQAKVGTVHNHVRKLGIRISFRICFFVFLDPDPYFQMQLRIRKSRIRIRKLTKSERV
jgi:hypothetical protein